MSFAEIGMRYPDRNPDIVSGSGSGFRGPDSIRTRIRTSCPDSAPPLIGGDHEPFAGRRRYGTFMRHMGHRSSQTADALGREQSGGAARLELEMMSAQSAHKELKRLTSIEVKEP